MTLAIIMHVVGIINVSLLFSPKELVFQTSIKLKKNKRYYKYFDKFFAPSDFRILHTLRCA